MINTTKCSLVEVSYIHTEESDSLIIVGSRKQVSKKVQDWLDGKCALCGYDEWTPVYSDSSQKKMTGIFLDRHIELPIVNKKVTDVITKQHPDSNLIGIFTPRLTRDNLALDLVRRD